MRLLKGLIILALLWTGYWFVAGYGLRQSVEGWFDARRGEGWQAEFAGSATAGFPLRHVTTLTAPALADPGTGTAWRADWLTFQSPAIWPGHQTVTFPDTPQRVSYFDVTNEVMAAQMTADMHLDPGLALQLERASLDAAAWSVSGSEADLAKGEALLLAMQQDGEVAETYAIDLSAPGFEPGPRLRRLMGTADTLPAAFQALTLTATVTFDRPWDLRSLEDRRPQPRRIDLRLAEAVWGPLQISVAGDLTVDDAGVPTGDIAIRADNWREMLRMGQSAGAVPQQVVQTVERALGFLAGLGGNPESLDVQLNFRNGLVAIGPVPLGQAPRLILR